MAATQLTPTEKAQAYDELERIHSTTTYKPNQREFLARMWIESRRWDKQAGSRVASMTVSQAAKLCGVNRNTAAAMMQEFAGLVHYEWEPARNEEGKPYAKTTITVADRLPDKMPDANRARLHEADREREQTKREDIKAERREFAQLRERMADLLKEHACPACGEVGTLEPYVTAACSECGAELSQNELARLVDGYELPATPARTPCVDADGVIEPPARTPSNGKTKRALRELKGKETPPAPATDYEHFDDPGINVIIERPAQDTHARTPCTLKNVPNSQAQVASTECVSSVIDDTKTLTGEATIEYLAAFGAKFSAVRPSSKAGANGMTPEGYALNYLDTPLPAETAIERLKAGYNIGLLCEHSDGLAVVDVDIDAPEFLAAHPGLVAAGRVVRRNAPGRCKLVVMCPDVGESRTFKSSDGSRRIELIGRRRHAIIAGTHESGAPIEFIPPYDADCFATWAELVRIAERWTGASSQSISASKPVQVRASQVKESGDLLRDGIQWWIAQPANQADVDRLLSGCKRKGQYVAVRVDDGTPSTKRTDTRDGYCKRTWRDYGSGETLDDYELHCRLTGTDKRTDKWRVVDDYLIAHGKQPLQARRPAGEVMA